MSGLIGADSLIAKCRKLYGAKTNEFVGQAVLHAGKTIVQPEAKLRAPANEGELRNSISKVESERQQDIKRNIHKLRPWRLCRARNRSERTS